MSKNVWMTLAVVFVAAGCGSGDKTVTVDTPQGSVKASTNADNSKTTIETPEGKATYEGKDGNYQVTTTDKSGKTSTMKSGSNFDVSEMGVTIYPGSTEAEVKPTKLEMPEGTSYTCSRQTSDAPSQVSEFYKKELKEATTMKTDDGSVATGKNSAGDTVMITASKGASGTQIVITVLKAKKKT